jgi:nitroimidazol reductase NimA-like FMN-containing flavoprotein (pyridoxamine 5'-phosphate oxidase superfamily)
LCDAWEVIGVSQIAARAGAVAPSARTRVRRHPERARYEPAAIADILDGNFLCHLGFVARDQPFVIPTLYGRDGERVLLHGSGASRALRALDEGFPCSVAVTSVDGLVLARSAMHHSVNYRSVLLLGVATAIVDREEKVEALRIIVEHVLPGRWDEVRPPSEQELRATLVLSLPIDEASAKVRTGPPKDDEADVELPVWAGVVPFATACLDPVADPSVPADVGLPASVLALIGRTRDGAAAR